LKQVVIQHLVSLGINTTDAGPMSSSVPVDYPDFANLVGRAVTNGEFNRGVLICGSGIGMSIAANRIPGVRAALCDNPNIAQLSRAHNDSNVLCLGSYNVEPGFAIEIVNEWLNTEYEKERHERRLAMIDKTSDETPQPIPTNHPKSDPFLSSVSNFQFGVALSPRKSSFSPLLFSGRLEDGIRAAAEAGFQLIELSLRSPEDIEVESLRALLDRYGLSLSAIATGQAYIEDGLCLCDLRPIIIEKTRTQLKSIIQIASNFKAGVIIGGIRGRLTGSQADQKLQRVCAIQTIQECARFAEDHSTALFVEPINRYETNFINSSIEALALLDEIGKSNISLLLDTFHMNIEEVDIVEALKNAGNYLGYVHISDSNRLAPGQGHIDFPEIFQTLYQIGYRGAVTTEILPMPSDETAMQQAGHFIKFRKEIM
jgi:RpiB/LacA/LacB family sugar-phosphate isomerase